MPGNHVERSTASLGRTICSGLLGLGWLISASASVAASAAHGYSWEDVARWPDFGTGTWSGGGGPPGAPAPPPVTSGAASGNGPARPALGGAGGPGARLNIPFTAAFRAQSQALRSAGPPGKGNCEPMGVIADSGSAFYFSKDVIVIGGLSDWYNVWRRIYMDGRQHDNPEPSYFGQSIGHWEGKTLVIDTIGIRAEAQILQGVPVGNTSTHVIERFRLLDPNTLELIKTVENPEVFTKPWVSTRTMKRTQEPFYESYCWTDRDAVDGTDLTPPP